MNDFQDMSAFRFILPIYRTQSDQKISSSQQSIDQDSNLDQKSKFFQNIQKLSNFKLMSLGFTKLKSNQTPVFRKRPFKRKTLFNDQTNLTPISNNSKIIKKLNYFLTNFRQFIEESSEKAINISEIFHQNFYSAEVFWFLVHRLHFVDISPSLNLEINTELISNMKENDCLPKNLEDSKRLIRSLFYIQFKSGIDHPDCSKMFDFDENMTKESIAILSTNIIKNAEIHLIEWLYRLKKFMRMNFEGFFEVLMNFDVNLQHQIQERIEEDEEDDITIMFYDQSKFKLDNKYNAEKLDCLIENGSNRKVYNKLEIISKNGLNGKNESISKKDSKNDSKNVSVKNSYNFSNNRSKSGSESDFESISEYEVNNKPKNQSNKKLFFWESFAHLEINKAIETFSVQKQQNRDRIKQLINKSQKAKNEDFNNNFRNFLTKINSSIPLFSQSLTVQNSIQNYHYESEIESYFLNFVHKKKRLFFDQIVNNNFRKKLLCSLLQEKCQVCNSEDSLESNMLVFCSVF